MDLRVIDIEWVWFGDRLEGNYDRKELNMIFKWLVE